MLKIISALPGGGKTSFVYENLRAVLEKPQTSLPRQMYLTDAAENPDLSRAIIIVPEQFHFETEHILYKKLGARLIGGVEITSFTKLSSEINAVYGRAKPYADRVVREITMFKVLNRLGKENRFVNYSEFNKGRVKPDAAVQILGVIEEFQRQGLSFGELEALLEALVSDEINPRLSRKMSDLAKIYKAYSDEIEDEYANRLDDTVKAAELSLTYGYFTDREIFIDGFDGFTGSQLRLIKTALKDCETMTVTLLADKIPTNNPVYKTSSLLYERLKRTAREAGKKTETINLSESRQNTFKPRKPEIYPAFIAADVYSECEWTAAKIRELVTKKGYSYNDISIITREHCSEIAPALYSALKTYGISIFADIPSPVIEKPLVRFMITALEAASFKPEKLLLYIKSGFVRIKGTTAGVKRLNKQNYKFIKKEAGSESLKVKKEAVIKSARLSRRAISLLEEAAVKYKLRSSDWRNEFPEGDRLLKMLEPVRKEIITLLEEFGGKLKNTTGDIITETLADFLINKLEIQRTIISIVNKRTNAFNKGFKIDRSLNDEYRQLWETIISVLEAMHAALLGYPISAQDYTSILISVLGKTEIAKPPQVLDAVTVGDALRTRTEGIKVAFILGVNQGVFPKSIKSEGEFNPDEIEELLKSGIEISENRTEKYLREKFIVNKTLFCPSERLYLSAPLSGLAWNSLEQGSLLSEVCGKSITASDLPVSFFTSTVAAAENILALNMDNINTAETLKSILNLSGSESYEKIKLFISAQERFLNSDKAHLHKIDADAAKALMHTSAFSPSGIDTLNACSFKYFCERGLNIKASVIENEITLNQLQRGNLIHYCLYKALSDHAVNINGFTAMKPAQLEGLAEQYIKDFYDKELMSGYARTERQNTILQSYKPRIVTLLDALRRETGASAFKPHVFEESFSYSFSGLPVTGKTDRYDIYSDGTDTYVRVVDYKTGKRNKFDYHSMYYGLGLQVMFYLYGVLEKHPDWLPAGAFYFSENIGVKTNPTVPELYENQDSGKEKIRVWLENHKHAGIEFTESNDLDRMENAAKNAAGYTENDRKKLIERHVLSRSDYDVLKKHTENVLKDRLDSLYNGEVYALPVKTDKNNICEYCEYYKHGAYNLCGNDGKHSVKIDNGALDSIFEVKNDE